MTDSNEPAGSLSRTASAGLGALGSPGAVLAYVHHAAGPDGVAAVLDQAQLHRETLRAAAAELALEVGLPEIAKLVREHARRAKRRPPPEEPKWVTAGVDRFQAERNRTAWRLQQEQRSRFMERNRRGRDVEATQQERQQAGPPPDQRSGPERSPGV